MASAPALPLSLTLPLPLPLPVSPPLGSTCLLTGLVSAADINGKPVEILELPTKTTGFRFVVTYSSGGDVKRTLRVKPECLLLCCALRTCLSTDQKVLLVCSGCKADAYCCREHQTEDWKLSHQRKCKLFRTRDDGEPYKLIDLKIPLEQELHRLILRRHVEITFLLRERKEQLKCDLSFFQEKIAQAQIKMLTDWGATKTDNPTLNADVELWQDRDLQETHLQLDWCISVSSTDSMAVLEFKNILHQVHDIIHDEMRAKFTKLKPERARKNSQLLAKLTPQTKKKFIDDMKIAMKEMAAYVTALEAAVKRKHPGVSDVFDLKWLASQFPAQPGPSATTARADPLVHRPPFYPGPSPFSWEGGWDLFKVKRIGVGSERVHELASTFNVSERIGMVPSRLLGNHQKTLDFHSRFYDYNYPRGAWTHYDAMRSPGYPETLKRCNPLPFWQHKQLHRQGNAVVRPKKNCPPPQDSTLLTLDELLQVSDIEYPVLQVAPCEYCGKLCLGECLCGEAYCSAECHRKDWDHHEQICTQVLSEFVGYSHFLPMAYGPPFAGVHHVYKADGPAAPDGPTGFRDLDTTSYDILKNAHGLA